MTDHSEPNVLLDLQERSSLSGNYVKWSIFGVALPLLPLFAHVLAALLSPSPLTREGASFTSLFSDGELLVIATVIAAAAIGDLLFDFPGRDDLRTRTFAAVLCAIALLIVVVSVLMYGLVAVSYRRTFVVGSTPAAYMSVIMFLAAAAIGAVAIWFHELSCGVRYMTR